MGVIELSWFDEPNAFHIAIGADDVPFVKHDETTVWLISLINMGNKCQEVTTIFCCVGPIVQNHTQVCQSTASILFTILPVYNPILSVWETKK